MSEPIMWHAIGILLLGVVDPAVIPSDEFSPGLPGAPGPAAQPEVVGNGVYPPVGMPPQGPPMPGFQSGLMPGEQPVYPADAAAAGGAMCYPGMGNWFRRPCNFDEYWDYTGQRSPTDYANWDGYGPDWCRTWNARVEWLMFFTPLHQPGTFVSSFDALTVNGVVNPTRIGGDNPISNNMRNGARVTLGRYLGDTGVRAEGRFWGVEDGSDRFVVTALDNQHLAIPRIDGLSGLDSFYIVNSPGVFVNGAIDILAKKDLIGADAWVRSNWWDDGTFRFDGLAGYQFLRMDDSLQITTTRTVVSTQVDTTRDSFITNNEFHGGTLGFVADWRKKALSLELLGKLGFGSMRQRVLIDGRTSTRPTGGGAPAISSNGLFSYPSNEGEHLANRFMVLPELNANLVIHMSPGWRILGGYSLLYLNEVVMAFDQIDPRVNTSQPVGPPLPAYLGRSSTMFIQGINLGLDFSW